jgi:hypothetical protein
MNFYTANAQSKKEREGKERKKEKKSHFGPNHVGSPYMCYPKMKRTSKRINNTIESRLQPSERVAQAARIRMMHARHAPTAFFFFFLLQKLKMSLGLNNTNKQTISEITAKPLKSRLKNSNGKSNPVIQLFYKI